jgi:hypothetical protein
MIERDGVLGRLGQQPGRIRQEDPRVRNRREGLSRAPQLTGQSLPQRGGVPARAGRQEVGAEFERAAPALRDCSPDEPQAQPHHHDDGGDQHDGDDQQR